MSDGGLKSDELGETLGAAPRLRGAAAWRAHLTLAAGLALCVTAFWFEIGRAEGGNSLSWAYVFEWPLLAVFAVYMWWKVLHPGAGRATRRSTRSDSSALAPEFSGMLTAWQEHQRDLAERQAVATTELSDERERSRE